MSRPAWVKRCYGLSGEPASSAAMESCRKVSASTGMPSRRRRSRVASSGSPGTRIEAVPLPFSERSQSNTASSRSLKGPAVPNLSGETITENIELKVAGLLRGPVCVLPPGNAPASNSQAS